MSKKQFNQRQKLAILKSTEKMSVRDAADIAGIHYTTIYDWRNQFEALGVEVFLEYQLVKPRRGIKKIDPNKEQAVLKTWHDNP